jgi:hypothetical protein
MKEQSHKREMDAAVRADFARLRARGVATTIVTEPEETAVSPVPPAAAEPVADPRQPPSEPEPASLRRLFRRRS